jgi:hypothetical protein
MITQQFKEDIPSGENTRYHYKQVSLSMYDNNNSGIAWIGDVQQLTINRPKCRDKTKTLTIKADSLRPNELNDLADDSGIDTPKDRDAVPDPLAVNKVNSVASNYINRKTPNEKPSKKGILCAFLACFNLK